MKKQQHQTVSVKAEPCPVDCDFIYLKAEEHLQGPSSSDSLQIKSEQVHTEISTTAKPELHCDPENPPVSVKTETQVPGVERKPWNILIKEEEEEEQEEEEDRLKIKIEASQLKDELGQDKDPKIWIMGDRYIRRAAERARVTMGSNLGLNAKVSWFGHGGMRWKSFMPAFQQTLQGRVVPDVLVIHCGGNDLGSVMSLGLVSAMKQDLQALHEKFPQMTIVFSAIIQRRQWRSANPAKINKARKWLNSTMTSFVSNLGGFIVHHRDITYDNPDVFLNDGVHLAPEANDLFLNKIADCLKTFIH